MILIVDFGSQYTLLIAKTLRQVGVYSEVCPYHRMHEVYPQCTDCTGVILSGGPCSVNDSDAPRVERESLSVPVLGICYGAQLMASCLSGVTVNSSSAASGAEYGEQTLEWTKDRSTDALFAAWTSQTTTSLPSSSATVWMSHGDHIVVSSTPDNEPPSMVPLAYSSAATTGSSERVLAAFVIRQSAKPPRYGVQFHPEVTHTSHGASLLHTFATRICQGTQEWTPSHIAERVERRLADQLTRSSSDHSLKPYPENIPIVLGVSGGIDSTVAAMALHRYLHDTSHTSHTPHTPRTPRTPCTSRLLCVFVNNGLLRDGEVEEVQRTLYSVGLRSVHTVDASEQFLNALAGVTDPEDKRKTIGRVFIEVFAEAVKTCMREHSHNNGSSLKDSESSPIQCLLAQGTIYPDVIESANIVDNHTTSATIKSHHNVGGLPPGMDTMGILGLVEPLRDLFKDDVRQLGRYYGLSEHCIGRHPFPGPGLAIRILGEVTPARVRTLQRVDRLFIEYLKENGLYDAIWQAGAILLPCRTVGVQGDRRSYQHVVALRAVTSVDGMTAQCYPFAMEDLMRISTRITNGAGGHHHNHPTEKTVGVSRVVYDISSKPPATIEWE